MGEKTPKRKNSPFGCPPFPFYDMEADYFPVSENAENKRTYPKKEGEK